MTKDEAVAYIHAQTACAMIEAMGMAAENKHRELCGEALAYREEAFDSVLLKYGIHHNDVLTTFQNAY